MHILVAPPPSLAPRTFVPSALHQPLRCSASAGSPPPSSSARTPPPPPPARRSHPATAIAEPAGSTRTMHETHARLNPLTTLRPARARCGDDMISAPTECGAAQTDSDTRPASGLAPQHEALKKPGRHSRWKHAAGARAAPLTFENWDRAAIILPCRAYSPTGPPSASKISALGLQSFAYYLSPVAFAR
ncbi:hypothetical protein AcV5_002601 [Taiwanofungus camphoratus]|nr:hypothetical protein AcV5_002601 [Antrodia cinnamomea]